MHHAEFRSCYELLNGCEGYERSIAFSRDPLARLPVNGLLGLPLVLVGVKLWVVAGTCECQRFTLDSRPSTAGQ